MARWRLQEPDAEMVSELAREADVDILCARVLELERRIKETDELEARIEVLERAQETPKGARPWGA